MFGKTLGEMGLLRIIFFRDSVRLSGIDFVIESLNIY